MDLKNVVDWLSLDVRPGDPLKWLSLSPHVLGRVPHLLWVINTAQCHAASAKVATWAEARGFNAWDLGCLVACLEIKKSRITICVCGVAPQCACGRRYTVVDHGHGTNGNLYCEVNRDLRALGKAAPVSRGVILNVWGPFMHYCLQGLLKCPTVAPGTLVWRARPESLDRLCNIYRLGDEVIYCGFTSTTLDFKVACHNAAFSVGAILELTLLEGFHLDMATRERGAAAPEQALRRDVQVACQNANYAAGTVLEMTLLEGYQLDNVSVYPRESEVLLPPNKRFVVTSAPIAKRVVGHKGGEDGTPKQKCKDPSSY